MSVCFQYNFHPVGQGLFASGCLYEPNKPQPKFVWVYDCGTRHSNPPLNWTSRIRDFQKFTRGKRQIDLLTLSHFDEAHITGVAELLRRFRVEALLIPYMSLWERLLLAFSKGLSAGDPGFGYFRDPVTFLRQIGGDNLGQIIVVGPDNDNSPPVEADGFPFMPSDEDSPWRIKIPSHRLDKTDPLDIEFGSVSESLEHMPSGQPILVEGFWEFCPYNAPLKVELDSSFREGVETLREDLLTDAKPEERAKALADLKELYKSKFTSSKTRNEISLFLYAGPVYSTWQQHKLLANGQIWNWRFPHRYPCYHRVHDWAPGITKKCSILYTGDGYLSKAAELDQLQRKLTAGRMARLGVVQVPHHGSKTNWHSGLARVLDPEFSVFSSDPSRGSTYHPDAEVLRDFWPYSPVRVNVEGMSYCGWLI